MATSDTNPGAIALRICAERGFAFDRPIGHGAFKESFRVVTAEGDPLALKILKSGCDLNRLSREIEAMQRCDHPNIGRLIEIGAIETSAGESIFLLETYLDGGTLAERTAKNPLSSDEALQIGKALAAAIAYLSEQELVHRDIKPENVMFRANRADPILVDFGLVRDLEESSLTKTWMMRGPGTPLYSAPEQLNNQKELIDWRCDQYALGVTLSMTSLGIHPYQPEGDSLAEAVDRAARREPQSERFATSANEAGMPMLIRMTKPFPVQRYCFPQQWLLAWETH